MSDDLEKTEYPFEREIGAVITLDMADCRAVSEVYTHVAGVPPKWEHCGAPELDYASFETCMRFGLSRPDEAVALARFIEGMVSVLGEERSMSVVDEWRQLATETDWRENRQINLDDVERDARNCLRNGGEYPISRANQIYGSLVSGWHGDSSYDADSPRSRAARSVTCEYVIRLTVAMGLLEGDVIAAYEQQQQEAEAARCNPSRGQTEPTSEELLNGLNGWLVSSCTTSQVLFDALANPGSNEGIRAFAVARFEPRNGWCTVSALTVSLSFQFAPLSEPSCSRIKEGVYHCEATSELICFSNAEDDTRARMECVLFEFAQQVVMEASYDVEACEWNVHRMTQ